MPQRKGQGSDQGLTVAVTGPTGDIGKAFIRSLERSGDVGRIVGMARRPFDPAAERWRKTEYRRGDVLDRASVEGLVEDADVVVHLAFIILGGAEESHRVNLEGSRNVFEAALAAGARRLVYASSVAAYGFHSDNPQPLTEDVPPRGSDGFYYSAHKAELEALLSDLLRGADTDAYLFRPCIVAGPQATTFVDAIPYLQLFERMPGPARRLLEALPVLKPVIPDPGVPFQLVHADDVATALRAGVLGRGSPGAYNLAADGELTMSDLAAALDWYALPVPGLAGQAAAEVIAHAPLVPPALQWLHAVRVPVVMDTAKARRELRWRPRHDARETLAQTVAAARAEPTGH
jgi:UDP-glucose 4-epimerase